MGELRKDKDKDQSSGSEDRLTIEARKARKYALNREILAKLEKQRQENRRRARRFLVNTELLEANGAAGNGSRILDLSMNGARLELPFSPPFMSQMMLKFNLQGSQKILSVVGRVLWSKMTLQRGWFEVGVQFYQNYWEIDHLLRLQTR